MQAPEPFPSQMIDFDGADKSGQITQKIYTPQLSFQSRKIAEQRITRACKDTSAPRQYPKRASEGLFHLDIERGALRFKNSQLCITLPRSCQLNLTIVIASERKLSYQIQSIPTPSAIRRLYRGTGKALINTIQLTDPSCMASVRKDGEELYYLFFLIDELLNRGIFSESQGSEEEGGRIVWVIRSLTSAVLSHPLSSPHRWGTPFFCLLALFCSRNWYFMLWRRRRQSPISPDFDHRC